MGGTSCDRHTCSLDDEQPLASSFRSFQEALDMAPEDEEFQVRGPLLCLYLDRAMTEATWQQIPWIEKMSGNMYEDVWINEGEQLMLEDLQGVDGELLNCATISITDQSVFLRSFRTHLNFFKTVIPTTMDSQWICFILQQHKHTRIPYSTKGWGS